MLLSWRDRVQVALCPDRIILTRLAWGMPSSLVSKHIVSCANGRQDIDWRPAMAVLRAAMDEPQWQGADVTIVLSNHFVHYLLVPWNEKLVTDDEWRAMVLYSFQQVFGDAADPWELRWSVGGFGRPILASAVDPDLLLELRNIMQGSGVKLYSIQPYLMAAFNHWRSKISSRHGAFLLKEPGRVCLACFHEGKWSGLAFERLQEASSQTLSETVQRLLLVAGSEGLPKEIYAFVADGGEEALAPVDGIPIRPLQLAAPGGFSPSADLAYAMALTVG